MAGRFTSTMLDDVVRDLGRECPAREGLPEGTPALLALRFETLFTGHIRVVLALEWVDSAGRALDAMPLAFYRAGDEDGALRDAVALGMLWKVPVRGASDTKGWRPIDRTWEPWL